MTSDNSRDPAGRYSQSVLAGAEYVRHITAVESDRQARSAFQNLVLRVASPGAALFDFGAGPGIDARFFAERDFMVEAYDVDPRMREFFTEYCRDFLDRGRVVLDCSSYREFVAHTPAQARERFDVVISNFAPLNLVDDLRELFAKFHALTRADGKVIASVLSPYYIEEMKSRLWWRNAVPLWRTGYTFLPGPQAPHFRRRLANLAQLSLPYFRLVRVYRGLPPLLGADAQGTDFSGGGRRLAWLQGTTSRFMFLEFRKSAL